jgi:uncharacterized protein YjiS (DUF1127 family)
MSIVHASDALRDRLAPTARRALRGTVRAVRAGFTTWRRLARERRELAAIDLRTRRDLCLTQADMMRYLEAPAWPQVAAAARAGWRSA